VRGADGLAAARRATDALFPPRGAASKDAGNGDGNGNVGGGDDAARRMLADELLAVARGGDVPAAWLSADEWSGLGGDAIEVCVAAGACASKGAARRLVAGGGVYVNDRRVETSAAKGGGGNGSGGGEEFDDGDLLPTSDGARLCVLRTGRKNRRVIVVTNERQ